MMGPLISHLKRTFTQHASIQVTTLVVLVGTFVVVTSAMLIKHNLNSTLTRWGDSVKMSVFLKDDIKAKDREDVRKVLEKSKDVEQINFLTKKEAAEVFQSRISKLAPSLLFDNTFGNPLPASFEVSFKSEVASMGFDKIVNLAGKLQKSLGVEEVLYGQGWIENYSSLVNKINISSWLIILFLLSGSLLVVGNSIRNSVAQRRDEIEILELVGGTTWSIRAPFIFEGLVLGTLASLAALVLVYFLFTWQRELIVSSGGIFSANIELNFLGFWQGLQIVFIGAGFGVLGSYFCVKRICTGWSAASSE